MEGDNHRSLQVAFRWYADVTETVHLLGDVGRVLPTLRRFCGQPAAVKLDAVLDESLYGHTRTLLL